ncbi:MAG: hypothetical protein JWO93_2028 [Micrococcaceae bacterium]|nr:hypothetical protein [Micrococcaceae bacterium]
MEWFDADGYYFARQVLQRGVAGVYLLGFAVVLTQFRALLGERGLLPVPAFLARASWRDAPSLFHWRYSDRLLLGVAWTGVAVALSLVLGLPQAGPPWVPLLAFLLLWFLYLSIVNVGQIFYGFGWESLLLEAGFLAAFLGSDQVPPPVTVLFLFRWLLFRLEFGAGMIKIRGDSVWRDLTALYYHHETQPMPNPASWWFHHLPKPLHRLEVLGNHITQLVVPFLLFAPQPVSTVAALIVVVTQGWLVLSGNFAWLNVLTMLLAFSALDDRAVQVLLPGVSFAPGAVGKSPLAWIIPVLAATALMVYLSYWPLRNLVSRRQLMNAGFNRWHLANAYGAFGSITRRRYEVVLEGTREEVPAPDTQWLEYEFKGKPGDPRRMPRQFAPWHLRLDWMMWFLAFGSPRERWFQSLVIHLLQADPAVLRLLRRDPFDGDRPRWVRARYYDYRFSSRSERRDSGQWWTREPVTDFLRPVSLR